MGLLHLICSSQILLGGVLRTKVHNWWITIWQLWNVIVGLLSKWSSSFFVQNKSAHLESWIIMRTSCAVTFIYLAKSEWWEKSMQPFFWFMQYFHAKERLFKNSPFEHKFFWKTPFGELMLEKIILCTNQNY